MRRQLVVRPGPLDTRGRQAAAPRREAGVPHHHHPGHRVLPGPDGPARRELLRPQRQAYHLSTSRGGIQFHPGHGEWIKILRDNGFLIDALHELYAPPDALDHPYYTLASAEWGRQWTAEEVWAAHLAD